MKKIDADCKPTAEQNISEQKTIIISCTGSDQLPLVAIENFQGGLKQRGKKETEQIITSILKYGFSFPFFIWKHEAQGVEHNYCLDGHGRLGALKELRSRGYELPIFPVCYIDAADEAEAKQKLLRLNSQYGIMSIDSVVDFMKGIKIEAGELNLPSGSLILVTPDFQPVGIDEQGRLDEKAKHICPKCGYEF